jgi:hypothetical protein
MPALPCHMFVMCTPHEEEQSSHRRLGEAAVAGRPWLPWWAISSDRRACPVEQDLALGVTRNPDGKPAHAPVRVIVTSGNRCSVITA